MALQPPPSRHYLRAGLSGVQLGCASNVGRSPLRESHCLLLRAKTTTCGVTVFGSSSVPTDTVTKPVISEFLPKSGLPHFGQKVRVTTLPLSESRRNSETSPRTSILSAANIAPVE